MELSFILIKKSGLAEEMSSVMDMLILQCLLACKMQSQVEGRGLDRMYKYEIY